VGFKDGGADGEVVNTRDKVRHGSVLILPLLGPVNVSMSPETRLLPVQVQRQQFPFNVLCCTNNSAIWKEIWSQIEPFTQFQSPIKDTMCAAHRKGNLKRLIVF